MVTAPEKERAAKIATMQTRVDEGLASGPADAASVDEIFEKARRKAEPIAKSR